MLGGTCKLRTARVWEGLLNIQWLLVGFGPKPVIDREELEASILGKQAEKRK
jgi:hypothetical protein